MRCHLALVSGKPTAHPQQRCPGSSFWSRWRLWRGRRWRVRWAGRPRRSWGSFVCPFARSESVQTVPVQLQRPRALRPGRVDRLPLRRDVERRGLPRARHTVRNVGARPAMFRARSLRRGDRCVRLCPNVERRRLRYAFSAVPDSAVWLALQWPRQVRRGRGAVHVRADVERPRLLRRRAALPRRLQRSRGVRQSHRSLRVRLDVDRSCLQNTDPAVPQ